MQRKINRIYLYYDIFQAERIAKLYFSKDKNEYVCDVTMRFMKINISYRKHRCSIYSHCDHPTDANYLYGTYL